MEELIQVTTGSVKEDFFQQVLGTLSLGVLLASFFFAFLGVWLRTLTGAAKRDPLKPTTPDKWDWKYFWNDNVKRFAGSFFTTLIVIFISIRFVQNFTGSALTMVYCFFLGFGLDKAIEAIKNYKK